MVPKTIVVREVSLHFIHMHAYQVVARCSQVYITAIADEGA